ncbi:MAG: L-serine ammonia-lyase, iron-sulfur-dependent subunit beta [Acetanaerobacterium sp.]
MDISIFRVIGPVMIGPSSSHTAGAARLARAAALIAKGPFTHISFGLHGSFAKTYKGHGTDKALVAGALGLRENDEMLSSSFQLAEQRGITFDFYEAKLDGMHENSVKITMTMQGGGDQTIIGSSIGGGQILIRDINGFDAEISLQSPTIIIDQYDKKGIISEVSKILADNGLNIASMRLSRKARGDKACCIIETDDPIPEKIERQLLHNYNIIQVSVIND